MRTILLASIALPAALAAQPAPLTPHLTIQPIQPQSVRIESVTSERGAVPYRANANGTPADNRYPLSIEVEMVITGLPPGARVEIMGVTDLGLREYDALQAMPITTRCRAVFAGGDPEGRADSAGRATLHPTMRYHLPNDGNNAGSAGPCRGPIALSVTPANLSNSGLASGRTVVVRPTASEMRSLRPQEQVVVAMTPAYNLPPWIVYRYDNTWALRRIFSFVMLADGASSCSGTSLGPANYPIGPHNRNGDLALQVRSGPAGTICRAVSPGVALPENVRLTAIDWDVETDGDCCVGDNCAERVRESTIFAPGHLPNDTPGTYQGIAQPTFPNVFRVSQPATGPGQHLVGFAHGWMACGATAVNDHGVRLVLRSATFEGPPGAALPTP